MIIGLTGGIASGKTTISEHLKEKNFLIYDADKIAKEILNETEVVKQMRLHFGDLIFNVDNSINKEILKNLVFSDEEKRKILNDIIHPKVYKYFDNIRKNKKSNDIIFFDIPLLYESGLDKLCDKVILVVADEEKKIERIIKRDKISKELAQKIISSQMSDEEKKKKADIILENIGSIEELKNKVERLCENLWK